jgi:hypothetical protein
MRYALGFAVVLGTCVAAGAQSAALDAVENACAVRGAIALSPIPAGGTITVKSATTVPPRSGGETMVLLRYEVVALGRTALYGVNCFVGNDGRIRLDGPNVVRP